MGTHWRKYSVGKYRLGRLLGQAVVVWKDEQGPHRLRLGSPATEGEARALLDAWVRDELAVTAVTKRQTVGELYAAYQTDRIEDGKKGSNFIDSWKALAPRFDSLPIDAITTAICKDYARDRLAAGVSVGSIWTELTRLRSCLNWAVSRRVIASAPYVWIPKKPAPKQRVLTPDEVILLIDCCIEMHVRLYVILSITTAGRKGAILQLKWERVDFERQTIDLREPEVIDPLTKRARKSRGFVPMTSEARAALLEAKAAARTDYVIEWNDAPVINIRKGFMMAAARAGLDDVTPHTLRHTVASWLASDGVEMEIIARHLGHRDPGTTRTVYAKPDVESLRPSADVIDMRIRRKKA